MPIATGGQLPPPVHRFRAEDCHGGRKRLVPPGLHMPQPDHAHRRCSNYGRNVPTSTFPRLSLHLRRGVLPLRISIAALAVTAALSGCGSESATPATTTTLAGTSAATAHTSGGATSAPNAANPSASTSPSPGTVTVPDVRGDRPALADQLLTAAGLHAHITGGTGRGPGGGQCVISSQTPDAETSVPTGTTIELATGEVGGQSPC